MISDRKSVSAERMKGFCL